MSMSVSVSMSMSMSDVHQQSVVCNIDVSDDIGHRFMIM